ncbi:hypothetical protein GCM10009527_003830 [Actinomadura nitritigenes]
MPGLVASSEENSGVREWCRGVQEAIGLRGGGAAERGAVRLNGGGVVNSEVCG